MLRLLQKSSQVYRDPYIHIELLNGLFKTKCVSEFKLWVPHSHYTNIVLLAHLHSVGYNMNSDSEVNFHWPYVYISRLLFFEIVILLPLISWYHFPRLLLLIRQPKVEAVPGRLWLWPRARPSQPRSNAPNTKWWMQSQVLNIWTLYCKHLAIIAWNALNFSESILCLVLHLQSTV